MTSVKLRIDHIAVSILDEARAADVEETIRTALALLASRLATVPLAASELGLTRALQLIELEPLPPSWFASPGAAVRIADELFRRIVEGRP